MTEKMILIKLHFKRHGMMQRKFLTKQRPTEKLRIQRSVEQRPNLYKTSRLGKLKKIMLIRRMLNSFKKIKKKRERLTEKSKMNMMMLR